LSERIVNSEERAVIGSGGLFVVLFEIQDNGDFKYASTVMPFVLLERRLDPSRIAS